MVRVNIKSGRVGTKTYVIQLKISKKIFSELKGPANPWLGLHNHMQASNSQHWPTEIEATSKSHYCHFLYSAIMWTKLHDTEWNTVLKGLLQWLEYSNDPRCPSVRLCHTRISETKRDTELWFVFYYMHCPAWQILCNPAFVLQYK